MHRPPTIIVRLVIPIVLALVCAGCRTYQAPVVHGCILPVQAGDNIHMDFGGLHLATEVFVVKTNGTLTLPYNQTFEAAGKYPEDLEREIHDRYVPQYFAALTVTVGVPFYYVKGEIKAPGRFPFTNGITVLKAISMAGGFTDKRKIVLIRSTGKQIPVDYEAALQNPTLDPPVHTGDMIAVSR